MTGDLYDQLISSSNVPLKWFCTKCEQDLMDKSYNGTICQNDKLDHLLLAVDKMMNRYETIEKKMESKCDIAEVVQLDSRTKHLEERVRKYDDELEIRISSIEEQLRSNAMATPVVQAVHGAVHGALQQDRAEELEIEQRKCNVIVHGVPESESETSDQRMDDDLSILSAMFHEVGVEDATVESDASW